MTRRRRLAAALSLALIAPSAAVLAQSDAGDLQRRLRDQVRYQNGLLIIRERAGGGITVAPATIGWTVDCGDGGLSVTFGSGTGDTENGVALQLGNAALSDDQCQNLAPAIGATVLAISHGQ